MHAKATLACEVCSVDVQCFLCDKPGYGNIVLCFTMTMARRIPGFADSHRFIAICHSKTKHHILLRRPTFDSRCDNSTGFRIPASDSGTPSRTRYRHWPAPLLLYQVDSSTLHDLDYQLRLLVSRYRKPPFHQTLSSSCKKNWKSPDHFWWVFVQMLVAFQLVAFVFVKYLVESISWCWWKLSVRSLL